MKAVYLFNYSKNKTIWFYVEKNWLKWILFGIFCMQIGKRSLIVGYTQFSPNFIFIKGESILGRLLKSFYLEVLIPVGSIDSYCWTFWIASIHRLIYFTLSSKIGFYFFILQIYCKLFSTKSSWNLWNMIQILFFFSQNSILWAINWYFHRIWKKIRMNWMKAVCIEVR